MADDAPAPKETRFDAENPRSKAAYDRAARMYKLEVKNFGNPDDTPSAEGNRRPIERKLVELEDAVGDKIRSVGKAFGLKRTTSQDDDAQAAARRDVKGYKKGGVTKKMVRGGGIESRGKTKGRFV